MRDSSPVQVKGAFLATLLEEKHEDYSCGCYVHTHAEMGKKIKVEVRVCEVHSAN